MTKTTQALPVKPEPLSLYVLHTPAAVRQHEQAMYDYYAAMRAIAQQEQADKEAAIAEASRALTQAEYFAQAQEREREKQAKVKAAHDAEVAAARAEVDRLATSPAIAEVMHRNEWNFLQEICHWSRRQYTLEDGNLHASLPGHYHASMTAPAAKGGK